MDTIGQYQNILVLKRSELEKFLSGYLSCTFVESRRVGCPDVMFHTIVKKKHPEGHTMDTLKWFKRYAKDDLKKYGTADIELMYTRVLLIY